VLYVFNSSREENPHNVISQAEEDGGDDVDGTDETDEEVEEDAEADNGESAQDLDASLEDMDENAESLSSETRSMEWEGRRRKKNHLDDRTSLRLRKFPFSAWGQMAVEQVQKS
jgi:hypothetical protein